MTAFLDTSILVRYLTADPPEFAPASKTVIEDVEDLILTDVVIAETAWVLHSVYELPRSAIVDQLVELLERENIDTFLLEKRLVIDAILLCRPSGRVSFPDSLIWAAARASGGATVYTFDRRFPSDGIEVRSAPSST